MLQSKLALFRDDVAEKASSGLFGGVIVTSGKLVGVLAFLALGLSFGVLSVLFVGSYDRRETVSGYIAPTSGLVRVVPPRAGVIASVRIADGEEVVAGQPLFSISGFRGVEGREDADVALIEVLVREHANVEQRIASERLLAGSQLRDAQRRIEELNSQAIMIRRQHELANERVDLISQEVARFGSLQASAHISVSVLDERRADLLAAQQAATAFARELEQQQAEVAALAAEVERIPIRLGAREEELYARMLEIERAVTEAEVQKELIVRAPVAGRVASLLAFPGQSVTPNQFVLAILPDDSQLQAVLLVPSHAAGFIQPGQPVRLRFDAFPHQRFGVHSASVYSVSRTMLSPGDQVGPLRLQAPAYLVVARLHSDFVVAYGESIPLQPDWTLQADVVRERMRIIEWIFDPIRAAVSSL